MSLKDIPVELVLEILSLACASSQATYRSLLLVSHQFHDWVRLECLRVVPIILEELHQLRSFDDLLQSRPELCAQVQYLWVVCGGHSHSKGPNLIEAIVKACTELVCLASTTRAVLAICSTPTFQHTHCLELTLVETWHPWENVVRSVHGPLFCSQLTHLRLHESLSPDFPGHHFKKLTHLAFSTRPIKHYLERHLVHLQPLGALQQLVITTFWWREEVPDAAASKLLELDARLAILHCRKNWTELAVWEEGVRGGVTLWDQAKLERKSMQILRNIYRTKK